MLMSVRNVEIVMNRNVIFGKPTERVMMSDQLPKVMHQLTRTSPKGGKFWGTCYRCEKENITIAQQQSEECPNTLNITDEESILAAIGEGE